MKLSVAGLGIISKIGTAQDLELLLTQREISVASLSPRSVVDIEFPDHFNISPALLRRMSHFAKISLLSACYAVKDSGLDLAGKSVGIIQGSVYGPIISGIQAFDDLIDFGDNQLSPTNFSGSVFNTSATYLSLAFGIQGCTLSHTCGLDTLYNALLSASLWLDRDMVDYVIMGIGDEYSPYFDQSLLDKGKQAGLLPSCEGWTTYILGQDRDGKYGQIECDYLRSVPAITNEKIVYSVWHEQINHHSLQRHALNNQACLPVYLRGSYPSGAAFDLALALVCNRLGRFPIYNVVDDAYHNQDLAKEERISCLSLAEDDGVFYFGLEKFRGKR
jgi:hypothetical protein